MVRLFLEMYLALRAVLANSLCWCSNLVILFVLFVCINFAYFVWHRLLFLFSA